MLNSEATNMNTIYMNDNDNDWGEDWKSERYIFQAGYGQKYFSDLGIPDIPSLNQTNELVFQGTKAANVIFTREYDDLVIYPYNTDDKLVLQNYFYSPAFRAFNFIFDDQILDIADVALGVAKQTGVSVAEILNEFSKQQEVTTALVEGDTLYQFQNSETSRQMIGSKGNDSIFGGQDYNIIDAGDGDDYILTDNMFSMITGGKGNDYIMSMGYNDICLFEQGHGQDIVNAHHAEFVFKGASADNVQFFHQGNNLIIKAYNSEDSVTIEDFFTTYYNFEHKLTFDDRSLSTNDIPKNIPIIPDFEKNNIGNIDDNDPRQYEDLVLTGNAKGDQLTGRKGNDILNGGSGDDWLYGNEGNDSLIGGSGNDYLNGGIGDDILIGGSGNDYLAGGYGNDYYIFEKGHGQDIIIEETPLSGEMNTIAFTDYASNELWFKMDYSGLTISHIGTSDRITIRNWDKNFNSEHFNINTADGKQIGSNQIKQLIDAMANFEVDIDSISSQETASQMQQFMQQANIAAYWG